MGLIHPIAYECGCIFAFMVDKAGWLVLDKRDHRGSGKENQTKLCEIHTDQLRKLGVWER